MKRLSQSSKAAIRMLAQAEGLPSELVDAGVAAMEGRMAAVDADGKRDLFSVKEAADFLRVSRTSLFRAEKEQGLKSVYFRGRKLFRRADLEAALRGEVQA
jgi:excisionase family DNA binding protein